MGAVGTAGSGASQDSVAALQLVIVAAWITGRPKLGLLAVAVGDVLDTEHSFVCFTLKLEGGVASRISRLSD